MKGLGCVWQWNGPDQTQKSKKFLSKLIQTFLLFISHQSFFYYYSNKKIITKQIFLLFYTKHFIFFLTSIKYAKVSVHFLKSIPLPNVVLVFEFEDKTFFSIGLTFEW
jgi:hypothetical protein